MNWEVKHDGRGAQFIVYVNTDEEHQQLVFTVTKAARGPAHNAAMVAVERMDPRELRETMESYVVAQGAEMKYDCRGWRFVATVNTDEDFLVVAKRINDDIAALPKETNVLIIAIELDPSEVREFMSDMANLDVAYHLKRAQPNTARS